MNRQALLDLLQLLSPSTQPRHQTKFGVPQCHDPSVHLTLLFMHLVMME